MRGFDPNSARWQCCCFHITRATYVMAAVEIVLFTFSVVRCLVYLASDVHVNAGIYWHNHEALIGLELATSVVGLLSCCVLMYGVRKRRCPLLLQHIPIIAINALVLISLTVAGRLLKPIAFKDESNAVTDAPLDEQSDDDNEGDLELVTYLAVISVFVMIIIVLHIYVGYLIIRCYHYIQAELEEMGMRWTMWRAVHRETFKRKAPKERKQVEHEIKHRRY